jgi:FkbM family methyltransferase
VLREERDGGVEIPVTTLDVMCKEIGEPDSALIVKVDVEGWETAVLQGA